MRYFPDKRIITFITALFAALITLTASEKLQKVQASYTYYAPSAMSVEQARITAFNRAVTKALTDAFGLNVSQTNTTVISDTNGRMQSQFLAVGESDVRGEWIETIGEPKYEITYRDELLVVNVKVSGHARLKSANAMQFVTTPLKNGTRSQDASTEFHDGDQLFVHFKGSANGFVAIFLLDYINKCAIRLLPYSSAGNTPIEVNGEKEYLFFTSHNHDTSIVHAIDEVEMTCSGGTEVNGLCTVFAATPFLLPTLSNNPDAENAPPIVDLSTFQKWLSRMRISNPAIATATTNITITNTNL